MTQLGTMMPDKEREESIPSFEADAGPALSASRCCAWPTHSTTTLDRMAQIGTRWRSDFSAVIALLGLALLAGLYGHVFTTVTDIKFRYALILLVAFVVVLAGPLYAFLRHKKRLPWPTVFMRIFLSAMFLITAMPIITVAGLLFGAIGVAFGFRLLYEGQVLRGLLIIVVWAFAWYGLVTLWSLATHFWTRPSDNPRGVQLNRNVIGLATGFLAIPALWMPAVVGKEAAALV